MFLVLLLTTAIIRSSHQEEDTALAPHEWAASVQERSSSRQQRASIEKWSVADKAIVNDAVNRVVGGNPISTQQYPFYVQADTEVSKEYCGGSLVAPDVVLTAAQCQNAFKSTRVLVGPYVRDSTDDGPAEWRSIIGDLVPHPGFDSATKRNDYMIFKIEPVTLANLKPVTLNTNMSVPIAGAPITVLGMGRTGNGANYSNGLRGVVIGAVPHTTCKEAYQDEVDIDETTMLCGTSTGNKDRCEGDTGGPVIDQTRRLVGIVSYGGPTCAGGTLPGVYSRVSGAAGWIQEQICQLTDTNTSLCSSLTSPAPSPLEPSGPTAPSAPTPTRRPTTRRPTSPSNGDGTTQYRVEVKYDIYPRAFAWKIRHPASGDIVVHFPQNRVTTPYKLLVQSVKLKPGRKYRLVLKDRFGVGLRRGYVKLYRGSKLVQYVKGQSIGAIKKIDFVAS